MKNEEFYKRFSLETRIQHIILFLTFFILVLTGFSLKYSDRWWAQKIVELIGGWEMRAHIHHLCGIILVGLGIYHFIRYVIVRRKIGAMMPNYKDIDDYWIYMKHQFNAGEFPKYDHFDWKHKFEYWGVVWGVLTMGLTGFILMFPFAAMEYMPYAWFNTAGLVHFYEATLATLVVFIWHFYNVHLNFEFPFQSSFITGKISKKMMRKEHRFEYERNLMENNK